MFRKESGILLHPTSLPGPYGVGELGPEARRWIDVLEAATQRLWQVLPLTPTGSGASPYQSRSSFAGNPLLVSLDDLGAPKIFRDLCMLPRGIVLVTGPTGSGKSTTLAGMIDHINDNRPDHILTIEDPIEFLHRHKKSIVNQREVGLDTKSYANALKSAMRAAPDVIQIGEIRDRVSMQSAIDMAGTGHLVLATLHSNNAPETLDRIINMFPQEQHAQIFMDLAHYLRAIISQRLVRSRTGRRVAAVELMLNTPHIKDLIHKGDISEVKEAIKDSSEKGVQNFDMALLNLYKAGTITLEEAMSHADSRSNLEAKVNFG